MRITTETSTPGHRPPHDEVATEPRGNAHRRKVGFGVALALVPAAVGGVVGLVSRSRRAGLIAAGASALVLGVARWQLERSFNDEPDYVVEEHLGELEIRRYDARIEAETTISSTDFFQAIDRGFERLARYIFGANAEHEKLGMTTPVTTRSDGAKMRVAFVMPMTRTSASLPLPNDGRIEVVEVPGRRVAVLCFSGKRSDPLIRHKMAELCELVAKAGLATRGEPMYAGFDPPWTLPMIRRNEVWIELDLG